MCFNLPSEVGGQDSGDRLPPSLVPGLDIYVSLWLNWLLQWLSITYTDFCLFFIMPIPQSELTAPLAALVSLWYRCVHVFMMSLQLCPTLCDPIDCSRQAPLSMGFPRRKYWRQLLSPTPGDLSNPGIEPAAPALAGRFFTPEPSGKPYNIDGFTLISTLVNIFNTSSTLKQKVGELVQEKEMFVYWEILLSKEVAVLTSFNPHNSFSCQVSLFPFYMKKSREKMT